MVQREKYFARSKPNWFEVKGEKFSSGLTDFTKNLKITKEKLKKKKKLITEMKVKKPIGR